MMALWLALPSKRQTRPLSDWLVIFTLLGLDRRFVMQKCQYAKQYQLLAVLVGCNK